MKPSNPYILLATDYQTVSKINKEMEAFNKAAKKGGRGIYDYLNDMMSADPGAYASTFRTSYDIEDPEALKAYE